MQGNGHDMSDSFEKKSERKAKKLIDEVKEKGKTLLDEGLESARDIFDEKKETVLKKAGEIREKSVEEIADDVKVYVRKSPWKSLSMAVGVGFLLGMMFHSND